MYQDYCFWSVLLIIIIIIIMVILKCYFSGELIALLRCSKSVIVDISSGEKFQSLMLFGKKIILSIFAGLHLFTFVEIE